MTVGWGQRLFGFVLVVALATGCWSRTEALTPGDARAGEAGYGVSEHTHIFYAVFAASVIRYYATAQVAMVDEGEVKLPDSVWQSYDGGREIRHCFVVGGQHVCRDAELDDGIGWAKSVVWIDPVNLGRFAQIREYADGDTYVYIGMGSVYDSADNRSRIGPNHGVWGVVAGDNTLMHCQLEGGTTPRCRQIPPDNDGLFKITLLESILGVFPSPEENVLWFAKRSGVYRCTATAAQPQPACVAARMQ